MIVVFHDLVISFSPNVRRILVREFAIGLGPKIFAHTGKRIVPFILSVSSATGGYVG